MTKLEREHAYGVEAGLKIAAGCMREAAIMYFDPKRDDMAKLHRDWCDEFMQKAEQARPSEILEVIP